MKKLILVLLFCLPAILFAQPDSTLTDTTANSSELAEQKKSRDPDTLPNSTSVAETGNRANSSGCACISEENELGPGQWILVFLPAIIFISLALVLFAKGLKNFKFSEALKENELTSITIQNPLYQNSTDPSKVRDLPPTIQITANVTVSGTTASGSNVDREYKINEQSASYRASISRYIALISSLMIIIIAVALSSFFVYHYIRTNCPPELEGLSAVLIALGLGIVPYAANKVSSAMRAKRSEA